jgi:hypothetical protein
LKPAFDAALSAIREARPLETGLAGAQLSRLMIRRVLSACAGLPPGEAGKLTALLRRFEADAAREEARELVGSLADDAALAAVFADMSETIAASYESGLLRAA